MAKLSKKSLNRKVKERIMVPGFRTTFKRTLTIVLFIMLAALLAACSGSSSSSPAASGGSGDRTVSALTLPDRVSLTDSDTTSSQALSRTMKAYSDSGTDYANQTTQSWVDDHTDALSTVNQVLGVMDQTNYASYVNYGPYKALVKDVEESKQSSGGQTSSSTTTENYLEMVLNVTRLNDSAPMYVTIWLKLDSGPGDQPMLVRGRFEVTREAGTGYPYGEFTAYMKGNIIGSDGSIGTDDIMHMALQIGADADGKVTVQSVETDGVSGGDFYQETKARVLANSDLSVGDAYTYNHEENNFNGSPETKETIANVSYNADHFKMETVGGDTNVFDKKILAHRIFRYKLFKKDDGSAVTLNSGFPVVLSGGEHAYVGYYGLWAPHGITINDGDTVTKEGSDVTYTVVKRNGKLTKHTEASIALSELNGVELSFWNNNSSQDTIVSWNGTNFVQTGVRNNDNGQIDYSDGGTVTFNEWEGAWCEALNSFLPLGRLYKNNDGSAHNPVDGDTLYYHAEEAVNPNNATDLTLYFGDFALDAPITQTVIDNADAAQQSYWSGMPTIKTYFFDASDLLLKETDASGDSVTFSSDLVLTGTRFDHGYNMMPLVTNEPTPETWFQAWDASTYYSWQTGNDEWQQFVTVKDADGTFASFDAPLRFSYTHTNANDANWSTGDADVPANGKKFNMDYDGFSLQIPWKFSDSKGEWVPMFNLKNGTTLTANGVDYVVKAVEEGLIMKKLSTSEAAAVTLDITTLDPPTLEYDSTVTDLVGDIPSADIPSGLGGEGVKLLVVGGETL